MKEKPVKIQRRVKGQRTLQGMEGEMGYDAIDLLSPEHERFCWHYATYGNGRAAYHYAYPEVSCSTAQSESSKLLKNPKVSQRLDEIRVEMKERYAATADDVIRYHNAVLRFDRSELLNSNGSLRSLHELPMDVAAVVDLDVVATKTGKSALLKIPTRASSAAELARIHGLYKDKLTLSGDVASMTEEEMKAELARLAKESLDELNAAGVQA